MLVFRERFDFITIILRGLRSAVNVSAKFEYKIERFRLHVMLLYISCVCLFLSMRENPFEEFVQWVESGRFVCAVALLRADRMKVFTMS